ncbi:unnamed protein product [Closterium sp. NIES-54]
MAPGQQASAMDMAVEGAEDEEEEGLEAATSTEAAGVADTAMTTRTTDAVADGSTASVIFATRADTCGAIATNSLMDGLLLKAKRVEEQEEGEEEAVEAVAVAEVVLQELAAVGKVTLHSLDYWVIDSGATYSMTPRADLLTELEPSPVKHVTSALGLRAEVKGMGKAMFNGADGKMVGLKNVLRVPNLAANLISVRRLQKAGMDTSSKGAKTYTARLGERILWDLHEDRDVYNEMWQIPVVPMPKERQVAASISTKTVGSGDGANGRTKEIESKKCNLGGTSKFGEHEESGAASKKQHKGEENPKAVVEEEYGENMWGTIASAAFSNPTSATGECDWLTLHRRMWHVALPILQQLVKNEMVAGIRVKGEPDEVLGCPTCMQAKFTRYPLSSSEATAKAPLDEVVMDVVGPLKLGAVGAEYFLTIVGVYTRMTWVYVLSKKSDVAETVKTDWMSMVERQQDRLVKAIRTDRGGEFLSKEFSLWLKKNGIRHSLTMPYSPAMNGIAERANRTITETARGLLIEAGLPDYFWPDAVRSACVAKNRALTHVGADKWVPYVEPQAPRRLGLSVPAATAAATAATAAATAAPACCTAMASLKVLAFDHEGRPVQFDTWLDDLQLYLLSDSKDSVSLFDLTSCAAPAPPATADSVTPQALYDAVVARYSSPAIAALGRLLLPYLFPELSAFTMVEDLVSHLRSSDASYRTTVPAEFLDKNQPPMFIMSEVHCPTVSHLLASAVTDPSFESGGASALVGKLLDFAAACRLDYANALVAESMSATPPSIGGECALGTDVLEDRQEDFECLATAVPRFASMLLAPEGDLDAPDIPTPRSYAEAIRGPYSSQWQAAVDAEMASWKSTGTYVDEVPPPGANIARYVARGFSQRQGVDYFQTFSPTPKMTTLRVLLLVAAQRDYELHSLDFSTAFLQGSVHEEIWLRRPPGFTGSFPTGLSAPAATATAAPNATAAPAFWPLWPRFEFSRSIMRALYDAVNARYSSPATASLGRLLLHYLFPELSAFSTVEDLVSHLRASDACYCAAAPTQFLDKNQPPMFITLYFIVTRLPDSLRSVKNLFLSLDPTSLTVDLLEQHLLATETSAVAVAGGTGGFAAASPGDPTVHGAAGARGSYAGGAGVGGAGAGGDGVGGTGGGGAGGAEAGAVDPGVGGAGGTVWPRPYFVPLLQQALGVPSSTSLIHPLLYPPRDQSQPPLLSASTLRAPSPYTE